jgi:hypothetical protein
LQKNKERAKLNAEISSLKIKIQADKNFDVTVSDNTVSVKAKRTVRNLEALQNDIIVLSNIEGKDTATIRKEIASKIAK